MRYAEILEAAGEFRRHAAVQTSRRRAREQLAAADHNRANAARKYQDDLEVGRKAAQQATAKLRMLSLSEVVSTPTSVTELMERPKSSALRDRGGVILGWIQPVGQVLQAKDRYGTIIGWYDGRTNQTRNKGGTIVGDGNLLSALILAGRTL